MPYLLGWNAFAGAIKPEVNMANPRREEEKKTLNGTDRVISAIF